MIKLIKDRTLGIAALGLVIGTGVSALQGCDPGAAPGLPGCDVACAAKGVADGNAAISGIAEVDAFFGAVFDVSAAAEGIRGALRAELDSIALSVGLEPRAAGVEIAAAVEAKLAIAVDGGLTIHYQAPRCAASVAIAIAAAASCDGSVAPGQASAECAGSCEVAGGVMASCDANAELSCTGTAPGFQCEGTCEGSCELEIAAACEGTCRGTCTGTCSVVDAQGSCAGACMGSCAGTCELTAGGGCSGTCTGACTYKRGPAGCEADASAKCEAMADGSVKCAGRCEGQVQPPAVKAECEASVEAKANASIECTPPTLDITWQWSSQLEGDAVAQAEFKAWLQRFKTNISVMLAAKAKADILLGSLDGLGSSGVAAISSATSLVASGDVIGSFKLTNCAIPQLGDAIELLAEASAGLSVEAATALELFVAIGL